jgi:hypothetical protein
MGQIWNDMIDEQRNRIRALEAALEGERAKSALLAVSLRRTETERDKAVGFLRKQVDYWEKYRSSGLSKEVWDFLAHIDGKGDGE